MIGETILVDIDIIIVFKWVKTDFTRTKRKIPSDGNGPGAMVFL